MQRVSEMFRKWSSRTLILAAAQVLVAYCGLLRYTVVFLGISFNKPALDELARLLTMFLKPFVKNIIRDHRANENYKLPQEMHHNCTNIRLEFNV